MNLTLEGWRCGWGFHYVLNHEEKTESGSYTAEDAIRQAVGPVENHFVLMRNSSDPRIAVHVVNEHYGVAHTEKEAERRIYRDLKSWAREQGHTVKDRTRYSRMPSGRSRA